MESLDGELTLPVELQRLVNHVRSRAVPCSSVACVTRECCYLSLYFITDVFNSVLYASDFRLCYSYHNVYTKDQVNMKSKIILFTFLKHVPALIVHVSPVHVV